MLSCASARLGRFVLTVLLAVLGGTPLFGYATPNGHLQLHFMHIGQGDGALLITPGGQTVLFDNGVLNQCDRPLAYLQTEGVTGIDYHIASHYHADHIGCTEEVLTAFPLQQLAFDRGGSYTTQTYDRYVTATGSRRQTAPLGSTLILEGGVLLDFIAANGAGVPGADDENDLSLAVRVRYGAFDAVLAGDLSGFNDSGYADVESVVASAVGQVEVYKVNHHASAYSSNATWLTHTQPKMGVISVGATNTFGHPTAEALARLHAANVRTYWTSVGNGAAPDPTFDTVGGDIVVDVPPGGTTFTVAAGDTVHSYTAWGAQGLPPGPPQALTGTVNGTTVILSWLPPTTGGVAASSVVEAALSAGGLALVTLPVGATTLTVPNVPNGTYFVRVRAINGDGQSAPSNEVVIAVPGGPGGCTNAPAAPGTLTGTVEGSLVTLGWSAPSTGCSPTHYILQAGSATGLSNVVAVNTGLQSGLSASAPPGTYFVRVVAVNAFGTSVPSNEVEISVGGGCTSPPNAPQGLIGNVSGTLVSLNWSAPAGGCEPTSYVVQAGRGPGQTDVVAANVGLQTSLSAGAPTGTYFVRVVALNAFGASAPSNEVALTVICPLPGAPALGAPSVSNNTVSFSWSPPAGIVTRYQVEAGSSSGASNLLNTSTTNTSYS